MGAALRRRLRSDISTTEALIALNRYVFDELGFSGNARRLLRSAQQLS